MELSKVAPQDTDTVIVSGRPHGTLYGKRDREMRERRGREREREGERERGREGGRESILHTLASIM